MVSVQRPSAGGAEWWVAAGACPEVEAEAVAGTRPRTSPGPRGTAASCHAIDPSGAVSVAVAVDGRTILYESFCVSATPSPFGETTASSGGGAKTP